MWRDRSLYTPQIKLFALLYSPVHKQRHRKRLESFIFGSGADDPGLCSFIGEHSPSIRQGWELQLQLTIDHPPV